MKTFKVYYTTGNQRKFEAESMCHLMYHLINYEPQNQYIYKIEEIIVYDEEKED